MAEVKFLKGLSTGFAGITAKDADTFYFLTDTKELYLGDAPISGVAALESLKNSIGTLTDLDTTAKTNLVSAINEIVASYKVQIEKDTDGLVYKFRQGEASAENADSNVIGTINIPKDMVVSGAQIVDDPIGQPAGKYIEMTIANAEAGNDKIYINVNDLVDAYSTKENATQIQLAISATNEISASIVAGGVGTTELADSAVTTIKIASDAVETAKIKDKAVTLAKLDQSVQDTLACLTWGTF